MIIESVSITCFGRLRDFSCTFDPKMNIIEGPNESGKSTLAAFIRYMLYGFQGRATSQAGTLSEKKKRISWEAGRAAGAMTVRVGEKRYRLERSTTVSTDARGEKETYRESGTILDLETNAPVPGVPCPGEHFLGVPEDVFLNTAFVGQVGSPRVDGETLSQAIENLLFSGDESLDVKRALEKLDTYRRTLLYKNGKGGEISDLEEKERDLSARLSEAQIKNAELLGKEAELEEDEKRLAEAETELAAAVAHEHTEECALVVAAYNHLHRAEEEKAEAERILHDLGGMPAYLLEENDLRDLAVARKTAEDAQTRYETARATRAGYDGEPIPPEDRALLDQAEQAGGVASLDARGRMITARRRTCRLLAVLLSAVGAVAGVAGFFVPAAFAPLCLVGGGLLLAAAVVVLVVGHNATRELSALASRYHATAAGFPARLKQIEADRARLSEYLHDRSLAENAERDAFVSYNAALSELDVVVTRFGQRLPQSDRSAFLDSLQKTASYVVEQKRTYEATRTSREETIKALREQLSGKMSEEDARAALPDRYEIRVENLHPDESRRQVYFYREQQKELTDRCRELERTVTAARSTVGNPAALFEELENTRKTLARAREQYEACVLAFDAISGAGERLRNQISPTLSHFAQGLVHSLTDGRYGDLGVGGDLSVTVRTGDVTRPLGYLSAGTQDLTYLALRMALIDLLYREKPPVCFDESFAHQDDGRAAHMMEVLFHLAEDGWQHFVFTCHSRERTLSGAVHPDVNVISLPL